jgi:RHS repeat-associated protein
MPATATTTLRRALTALLLCVFTLQTVVGHALAGEVATPNAAGYGALRGPAPDPQPTWGISAAGGQALDGLGRRVRWDFVAESGPAYKAEVVRDVVGRVASLTFGFAPSATAHWRGYGYDPATRLSDAWSWDGPAPAPDVSALLHHEVGAGQVAAFANDLAGVLHAPFDRAPQDGDLLSIGDAYEVTSARGPGHRLTALEVDGVAVTVDHDATGRVVEANPGYAFEYDPDERLMAVRDVGTGDIVERLELVAVTDADARALGSRRPPSAPGPTDRAVAELRRPREGSRKPAGGRHGRPQPAGVAATCSFAYDAFGRLAATYDANGLTQRFAWDGAQMVGAFDGAGLAKWDAVWGELDQLLAFRDRSAHPAGDVTVLPITDHRNSVVGAVASDASGTTLLAGADYTPMGRVVTLDPADDDTETCREAGHPGTRCPHPGDMPFGFAGAWRSEATGLVYMRFRWYSPALGQFLTPDPMGEVDGWNLYAYVGGDPINRWDPWGLDASAFADAALRGVAPSTSEADDPEPIFTRVLQFLQRAVLSPASEELYQKSIAPEMKRVPDDPVNVVTGGMVAVTPDVAPALWMLWFSPPGATPAKSVAGQSSHVGPAAAAKPVAPAPSPGGVVKPARGSAGAPAAGGARAAGGEASKGAGAVSQKVANQANHIFGANNLAKHKLGGVLESFGGDSIAAFRAIETGAQNLANSGAIKGIFETTVKVGEQAVTVRGRVIDGVVNVSTAFIP